MEYCHFCGSKVNSEEVFCSNCGTKLVKDLESEKKQTTQTQFNANENLRQSDNSSSNNSNIKANVLLKMVFSPVLGAKEFIEKGNKSTVIVITLFLVCMQGLLGVWRVNYFFSALESMSIKFIDSFLNLMRIIDPAGSVPDFEEINAITYKISQIKSFLNIPYGEIFLQNSLLFLTAIIVIFISIYLAINILSKNRQEPFLIYKTALILLVPTLYFEFFSIITSYLSFYIGIGVAAIGVIISLGCLTIILKEKFLIDENNSVLIVSVTFVLLTIVIIMLLKQFLSSNLIDIITSAEFISDILR